MLLKVFAESVALLSLINNCRAVDRSTIQCDAGPAHQDQRGQHAIHTKLAVMPADLLPLLLCLVNL